MIQLVEIVGRKEYIFCKTSPRHLIYLIITTAAGSAFMHD